MAPHLPGRRSSPVQVLAAFSLGVAWARRGTLGVVAEALPGLGKPDPVARRRQRVLSHPRLAWASAAEAWTLSWGTRVIRGPALRPALTRGKARRRRVLQLGLRWLTRGLTWGRRLVDDLGGDPASAHLTKQCRAMSPSRGRGLCEDPSPSKEHGTF